MKIYNLFLRAVGPSFRAYRKRVAGIWYLIEDRSTGWGGTHWSQERPAAHDAPWYEVIAAERDGVAIEIPEVGHGDVLRELV